MNIFVRIQELSVFCQLYGWVWEPNNPDLNDVYKMGNKR